MATSTESVMIELGERELLCETHGNYMSTGQRISFGKGLEHWTGCPGCKADEKASQELARQEREAAAKRDRIEKMMAQTAIPQRFVGRSFDNFKTDIDGQASALRVAQEFAENFDANLATGASMIFSGGAGTGKSHLATSILQYILPKHVGAYMTFMGMIRLIRETWRPDSARSESQVLFELGSLPLLVIDEIGVQYGTDAEHTLLFEVMDRRYRDQKPTILLTNQDKDGFKRFVGDRVYDRMTETARWVSFDWGSMRVQARKTFQ